MREYERVPGTQIIGKTRLRHYKHSLYTVRQILKSEIIHTDDQILEQISIAKGLFNRVLREDRDDWQEVKCRFRIADKSQIKYIAFQLSILRKSLRDGKDQLVKKTVDKLINANTLDYISNFLESKILSDISQEPIQDKCTEITETDDSAIGTTEDRVEHQSTPRDVTMNRPNQETQTPQCNDQMDDVIIWIYHGKHPCGTHSDQLEMVTAYVKTVRDESEHAINVNYCSRCNRYYISTVSFNIFAERYGIPLIHLALLPNNTGSQGGQWQEESILHSLGYNVNATEDVPMFRRHQILSEAMEAGIVSKREIIIFLERLINRNRCRANFSAAVSKWKLDLEYVSEYHVSLQRKVTGHFTRYK